MAGDASHNGHSLHGSQNGGPNTPHTMVNQTMPIVPITAAGAPATNLNIGMDYWGAPAASTIPAFRGKVPSTPVAGGIITAGSRDGAQSQLWPQVNFSSLNLSRSKFNCFFWVCELDPIML